MQWTFYVQRLSWNLGKAVLNFHFERGNHVMLGKNGNEAIDITDSLQDRRQIDD
jgi:hypothetical protein